MITDKEVNDKKKVYAWWLTQGSGGASINDIVTELGEIIKTEDGQNIKIE